MTEQSQLEWTSCSALPLSPSLFPTSTLSSHFHSSRSAFSLTLSFRSASRHLSQSIPLLSQSLPFLNPLLSRYAPPSLSVCTPSLSVHVPLLSQSLSLSHLDASVCLPGRQRRVGADRRDGAPQLRQLWLLHALLPPLQKKLTSERIELPTFSAFGSCCKRDALTTEPRGH